MAYKATAYTADSDADDEFERAVFTSSNIAQSRSPAGSDPITSPEHTPTFYPRNGSVGSHPSPTSRIPDWTPEQCVDFFKSLGLGQYADSLLDQGIDGEVLVEMQHQELKEIGIASVGHRLTVLKSIYDTKIRQNIRFEQDHYVPPSEATQSELTATQDDITRIIESIRLRDQRIIAAEAELKAMKDDLNRLLEDNRKLREETLPMIRIAKDRSQPLPVPGDAVLTPAPLADLKASEKVGSSLSRKFSTKRLFLPSAPKNPSPIVLSNQSHAREDFSSLDPSAAAIAASNHLTAGLGAQTSPSTIQQFSPTSPAYSVTSRHPGRASTLEGKNARDDSYPTNNSLYDREAFTGISNGLASSAASTVTTNAAVDAPMTSTRRERGERDRGERDRGERDRGERGERTEKDNSVEIFKSFRVSIEDPCHKVLPVALQRYNINDDWRQYALYIVHGDQERCLGLEEKPLLLFKQLDREGRKPMFMLRKHASPAGEGWSGPNASGANGVGGGVAPSRGVPGGVL